MSWVLSTLKEPVCAERSSHCCHQSHLQAGSSHRIEFSSGHPFIAVAPAKVLAFITHIYSAIFIILYLHYIFLIMTASGCCGKVQQQVKSLWLLIVALWRCSYSPNSLFYIICLPATVWPHLVWAACFSHSHHQPLSSSSHANLNPKRMFLRIQQITGAIAVDTSDSPDQRNDNLYLEKSPLLLINKV